MKFPLERISTGVQGCSTARYLLQTWETILEEIGDHQSATVLTSVDFSKGFNQVSHQHCLHSLAEHGSFTPVLALLGSFLQNHTMTVRINQSFLPELPVNGGCPQVVSLG